MSLKGAVRDGLVFILSGVFVFIFVSGSACADQGKALAQDKAFALAQENNSPAVTAQEYRQELRKTIVVEEESFAHNLDSYVRFMPLTGAKSQSGKVGLTAAASEYNYKMKAFGELPLEFALITKYIGINNSTVVALPSKLTTVSLGAQATLPFFNFDKAYFTVALAPSFFTDNWNFRSDSFHLLQRYFMIYQPNDKMTFILGASYEPGFRPAVFPIAGMIYRPNDRLTFNLIGSNPEIDYALNEKWTLFMEGEYLCEEYKVAQNNLRNAVLNYNEIRAGGGLKYSLNKHIEGTLAVGGVFNHSIEYRQDSLGKVALENGFYSEFRLSIVM